MRVGGGCRWRLKMTLIPAILGFCMCANGDTIAGDLGPGNSFQTGTGNSWATGDGSNSSNAVSFTVAVGKSYLLDNEYGNVSRILHHPHHLDAPILVPPLLT